MNTKRATVISFDNVTWTATVQLTGSLAVYLEHLPVARNIAQADMVAGRTAAILFFDPSNPNDAGVIAIFA